MQVAILGPNLRDQSKGNFHVHEAGCADITRNPLYRNVEPWEIEASSIREVVEEVYPPEEFRWEESEYGSYRSEFYFEPCTIGLWDVGEE